MRYAIYTKRSIFTGLVLALSLCLVISGTANRFAAVQTAKRQGRKLPVYCVDTAEKKMALTFDAAWGAEDTEVLLGILEEYHAKATFFVVGDFARRNPDAVRRLYKAGHTIGNHSDKHTLYSKLSPAQIEEDIESCNAELQKITGEKPKYLRAPSGDYTDDTIAAAERLSMQVVQWSVDSLDWQGLSVEEMVRRVLGAAESGSILLFHNDVKNTPEALREILKQLSERGYRFVTVDELLYPPPFQIDCAGKQHKSAAA